MAKSLFYRLFGVGKIPEQLNAQLKLEGLLLSDEGVKGSITYIDFRGPGRRSSWRRQWYTTAIALTELRLVALRYSQTIINVPFTDERFRQLQISIEEVNTLLIAFDAALFHSDWSGRIEYRFHTLKAPFLLDQLRDRAV